jgi:hypothetical protein
MDGESFDRLSVVVHRLRDQATRRGALRLLLGGSVAAAGGLLTQDADAKKHKNKKHKNKKHKNCRGYGAKCQSWRDCCSGNCFGNRCFQSGGGGGGGGGGKHCGGRRCPAGWGCCRSNGVSVCVPNNFPTCCGGNSYSSGYRCCGGPYGGACPFGGECCGGFNQCCQSGWKCCGSNTCIPKDWDCDDFFLQQAESDGVSTESKPRIPSAAPVTIDDSDWITLEP